MESTDDIYATLLGLGLDDSLCTQVLAMGPKNVEEASDWALGLLEDGGAEQIASASGSQRLQLPSIPSEERHDYPTEDKYWSLQPTSPGPTDKIVESRYKENRQDYKDVVTRKIANDARACRLQEREERRRILLDIESDRLTRRQRGPYPKATTAQQECAKGDAPSTGSPNPNALAYKQRVIEDREERSRVKAQLEEDRLKRKDRRQQSGLNPQEQLQPSSEATVPPVMDGPSFNIHTDCAIQLRMPSGSIIKQTFLSSAHLGHLFEFVMSFSTTSNVDAEFRHPGSFSICQSFPRRVFESDKAETMTFLEAGLSPRSMLNVMRVSGSIIAPQSTRLAEQPFDRTDISIGIYPPRSEQQDEYMVERDDDDDGDDDDGEYIPVHNLDESSDEESAVDDVDMEIDVPVGDHMELIETNTSHIDQSGGHPRNSHFLNQYTQVPPQAINSPKTLRRSPQSLSSLSMDIVTAMLYNPSIPLTLFSSVGKLGGDVLEGLIKRLIAEKRLNHLTLQRLRPCHISFLILDSYGLATDSLLESINQCICGSIEQLSLRHCFLITDAGALCLENLRYLRKVDFSFCRLTDKFTRLFVSLPTLTHVNLSGTKITPVGLLNVVRSLGSTLESLNISKCDGLKISSLFLLLQGLTQLKSLHISGTPFKTPLLVPDLGSFSKLKLLDAAGTCLTDDDISKVVCKFSGLSEIDISGCLNVTIEGMRILVTTLDGLSNIKLPHKDLPYDLIMPMLCDLPLSSLDLSGCSGVSDVGLENISKLASHLQILSLSSTKLTDKAVHWISNLVNLKDLSLDHTAISDAGTAITDAALLHGLSNLQHLVNLSVDGTAVTEAGNTLMGKQSLSDAAGTVSGSAKHARPVQKAVMDTTTSAARTAIGTTTTTTSSTNTTTTTDPTIKTTMTPTTSTEATNRTTTAAPLTSAAAVPVAFARSQPSKEHPVTAGHGQHSPASSHKAVTTTETVATEAVNKTVDNTLAISAEGTACSAFDKSRSVVLLQEYELGRFSDISVTCLGQTFRLHRIVLMQSPFFRALLLSNLSSSIISLRTDTDPRITTAGLETALRDLYSVHPSSQRKLLLNESTAIPVLSAACFLELQDLADYCVRQIAKVMSHISRIGLLASQLDNLDPANDLSPASYGPQHQYITLLGRYHSLLNSFCTATLCRFVGMHSMDEDDLPLQITAESESVSPRIYDQTRISFSDSNSGISVVAAAAEPTSANTTLLPSIAATSFPETISDPTQESVQTTLDIALASPLVEFLATLPMSWIKRLMESDWLCVRCEFDRYQITTQIIQMKTNCRESRSSSERDANALRSSISNNSQLNSGDSSFQAPCIKSSTKTYLEKNGTDSVSSETFAPMSAVANVTGMLSSLFEGFMTNKKRKIDSSEAIDQSNSQVGIHTNDDMSIGHNAGSESVHKDDESQIPISSETVNIYNRKIIPLRASRRRSDKHCASKARLDSILIEQESQIAAHILEKSIIYTYMTFPQLEVIKGDGVVPSSIVLESHWLQAELSNPVVGIRSRIHSTNSSHSNSHLGSSAPLPTALRPSKPAEKTLPKFRFGVRFDNVREQLAAHRHLMTGTDTDSDEPPLTIYSQSVICAGTQYRLVLCYEPGNGLELSNRSDDNLNSTSSSIRSQSAVPSALGGNMASSSVNDSIHSSAPGFKALLQRSRTSAGAISTSQQSISYRVYAFDHLKPVQFNDMHVFEPVTQCDFSGSGHARSLNIDHWDEHTLEQMSENHDSIWLIAVVEF
ncbi:hypothetical protein BSLG_000298 [Batrachochytrium salamandrivorans]|nr:hypothetical protein BSLG_000298 [Batrachochytrium salamandrivorans]